MAKYIENMEGDGLYSQLQVGATVSPINSKLFKDTNTLLDINGVPVNLEVDKKIGTFQYGTEFDENSAQKEKKLWTKAQREYAQSHVDELVEEAVKERIEFTFKADQDKIDQIGKLANPDYRPLTEEEKESRAALSERVKENYARICGKRNICIQSLKGTYPQMTRTEETLFMTGATQEVFSENDRIAGDYYSADSNRKQLILREVLERFASLPIEEMDLTDDNYIAEHMDLMSDIYSSGAEIVNLVQEYQRYNSMESPEDKKLMERLGAVSDMSYLVRMKVDIMASPLYSQLRVEDMPLDFDPGQLFNADGNQIEAETMLFGAGKTNKPYWGALNQVSNINLMYGSGPFLDKSLSPKERIEKYQKEYWNAQREIRPGISKVAEPAQPEQEKTFDEQFGNMGSDDDLELNKAPKKEERKVAASEPKPEKKASTPEELEAKLRRSIEIMKKIDPEFSMSEEEIKAHLSPKRIDLHNRMKEYSKAVLGVQAQKSGYNLPAAFARNLSAFADLSGTPEAIENNKKLFELVEQDTPEGIQKRAELLAEGANMVMKLDEGKLTDFSNPEAIGEYILNNKQAIEFGWEMQNMSSSMETTGVVSTRETQQEYKKAQNMGVDLGGIGVNYKNYIATEAFLYVPFEKMTADQAMQFMGMAAAMGFEASEIDELAQGINALGTKNKTLEYQKPEREFKAADFESVTPSVDHTKEMFQKMYQKIKTEDAWYNLNNSPEYKKLLKSLENVNEHLSKVDGPFTKYPDELIESIKNVIKNSDDYDKHVGKTPKNDRQKHRQEINRDINAFARRIAGSEISIENFIEKQNNMNAIEHYQSLSDDKETMAKEAQYEKGLQRTENMRERFANATGPERTILGYAIKARETIANEIGKASPRIDVLKPCFTVIMASTSALNQVSKDPNLALKNFENASRALNKSPALTDSVKNMSIQDLRDFLEGPGEHAFTQKFLKEQQRTVEAKAKVDSLKAAKEAEKNKEVKEPVNEVKGGGMNI